MAQHANEDLALLAVEEQVDSTEEEFVQHRLRTPRAVAASLGLLLFCAAALLAAAALGGRAGHGPEKAAARGSLRLSEEHGREEPRLGGPMLENGVPAACDSCQQRHSLLPGIATAPRVGESGGIEVEWFGSKQTKYFEGARIVHGGDGMVLTMAPFEKVYLMNSPVQTSTNPHDFAMLQLAGNSITVDVDMGNPGPSCGCNVAFFLVSMPGPTGTGDHYCDANCVGGTCCAEFDLMEMNVNALQVTSHQCSDYQPPPFASSTWACDHGGSPIVKFGNGAEDFGPGYEYTINSQRPFRFKMDFPIEDGILKAYVSVSQDGKIIRGTMDNLESVRRPLTDGMTLVLDAWHSENLMWLDGGAPVCHTPEYCNMKETIFQSIKIESLSSPGPAPGPAPSPGPAPEPAPAPPPSGQCPGQGSCGCAWAEKYGCGLDDGSECFCRCCCDKLGGSCKWSM